MSALLDRLLAAPGADGWAQLLSWFNRPASAALISEHAHAQAVLDASWPWALRVADEALSARACAGRTSLALELVRALDVGQIGAREAHHLADLEHAPKLKLLRLHLLPDPQDELVRGVLALLRAPLCEHLEVLELSASELPWQLAEALGGQPWSANLRTLRLTRARLDDALAALLLGAHAWPLLRELDLSGNRLGAETARLLARPGLLPALDDLDLSDNLLGDAAAEALASAENLSTLSRLNLQDNPMTEAASDALFGSWTLGEVGILYRAATDGRRVASEAFGEARSALSQPPSEAAWQALTQALEHARGPIVEEQLLPYCEARLRGWPEHLRRAPTAWAARLLREGHDIPALRLCLTWSLDAHMLLQTRASWHMLRRYAPGDGALARLELCELPSSFGKLLFGDDQPAFAEVLLMELGLRPREVSLRNAGDEPLYPEHMWEIPRVWPEHVQRLDLSGQSICATVTGHVLQRWLMRRRDELSGAPPARKLRLDLSGDMGKPTPYDLGEADWLARAAHVELDMTGVVVATDEEILALDYGYDDYRDEYDEYDEYDDEWE